jgi:hypothetical protein
MLLSHGHHKDSENNALLRPLEDGNTFLQNVRNHYAMMQYHIPGIMTSQPHHCENLSTSTGHVLAILMGHPDVLHITKNMHRKFILNMKHKIIFIFHIKYKLFISIP